MASYLPTHRRRRQGAHRPRQRQPRHGAQAGSRHCSGSASAGRRIDRSQHANAGHGAAGGARCRDGDLALHSSLGAISPASRAEKERVGRVRWRHWLGSVAGALAQDQRGWERLEHRGARGRMRHRHLSEVRRRFLPSNSLRSCLCTHKQSAPTSKLEATDVLPCFCFSFFATPFDSAGCFLHFGGGIGCRASWGSCVAEAAAAMIAQARGGDHDYLVGVHDCTYKVFSSDWGLWKFCLCAKKYDREGIPRTTLVQVGLGFVPKEGQEHMLTVLHLMKEWHSSKNNDLSQFLHQVHADESLGGQNALRKAFPKTVFVLDVRHQVSSIMRRAGSKKEVRAMVAANMQFALSALGFSRPLFSLYIDSLLVRLVELGELDLAAYLQKDVVEKVTVEGKEMWTSACCCFISLLGTSVKFQSHEASRRQLAPPLTRP